MLRGISIYRAGSAVERAGLVTVTSCTSQSMALMARPNGLPISRRERTNKRCQKANDLAREAVGCMGVFGRVLGAVWHSNR
jgi:hypothetical protein